MNRKAFVTLTSAALLAGALAFGAAPAAKESAVLGKPAPAFALTDHAGRTARLADFAGKVVVLEWMNPDCPVSRRHYTKPTMKGLAVKYAPKGVVWLAVNSTHYWTPAKNKAWAEKHKLPYPILDDSAGDVGRLHAAKTTPDMRIVDAKGTLVYAGAIDDDPSGNKKSPVNYVAKALDELLAGGKVSRPQTRAYGCSVKYAAPVPKAPAFTLADPAGKKVSLSDFAGRTVVLEWINPDCPFSKRHYTRGTMKRLAETYAPKRAVWLAINTTHYWTPAKNKAWAEKYELPYPILDDSAGVVGRLYGAKTTPDMRIIDARGSIVYSGAIDDDQAGKSDKPTNHVAKALEELVAGKKVSTPRTRPYGCSVKYAPKARK